MPRSTDLQRSYWTTTDVARDGKQRVVIPDRVFDVIESDCNTRLSDRTKEEVRRFIEYRIHSKVSTPDLVVVDLDSTTIEADERVLTLNETNFSQLRKVIKRLRDARLELQKFEQNAPEVATELLFEEIDNRIGTGLETLPSEVLNEYIEALKRLVPNPVKIRATNNLAFLIVLLGAFAASEEAQASSFPRFVIALNKHVLIPYDRSANLGRANEIGFYGLGRGEEECARSVRTHISKLGDLKTALARARSDALGEILSTAKLLPAKTSA